MDGEEKFWLLLWGIAAVVVVVLACSSLLYFHHKNEQLLRADSCRKLALINGDAYNVGSLTCVIEEALPRADRRH